jgi:N-acetylglucosamine transport system substrate-binding protein
MVNTSKMLRTAVTAFAAGAVLLSLGACGTPSDGGSSSDGGKVTLKMAALEGGYGVQMYKDAIAAYEKINPNVTIELQTSKSIEDEITPSMKAGDYPDIVELGQGRAEALPETLIKENAVEDVSDVLDMTIPGESGTVRDKLIDGIVGGLGTNPYGDDKTYLMPTFYAPTGLVYNKTLLADNGWTVPTTWDEMFKLGDEAKAKGISLFTYPTTGYLDSYFFSLLADVGGQSFYNDVMTYKTDVWKTDNATKALDLTTQLLKYINPQTVGYANQQDFTKNQQSILDGTSIFMPNGTWIVGEMADAPRTDGFEWGLAPLPSVDGTTRYLTTSTESVWIPKKAKHIDEAKKFMAFLYSDAASDIFLASGAVQPIKGITDKLDDTLKPFYDTYNEDGVLPIVGGFASTQPVPGVDIKATLFDTASSIVSGDKTEADWQDALNTASNALGAAK